jgi:hypothetical protein
MLFQVLHLTPQVVAALVVLVVLALGMDLVVACGIGVMVDPHRQDKVLVVCMVKTHTQALDKHHLTSKVDSLEQVVVVKEIAGLKLVDTAELEAYVLFGVLDVRSHLHLQLTKHLYLKIGDF